MYIEDDLDLARRRKKHEEEEEESNKISISLKPKSEYYDDEEYVYENPEAMGVYYDEESSNNKKIIEQGFMSQDSIPVHINNPNKRGKDGELPNEMKMNTKTKTNPANKKKGINIPVPRKLQEVQVIPDDSPIAQTTEKIDPPHIPNSTASEANIETKKESNLQKLVEGVETIADEVFNEAKNITSSIIVNNTVQVEDPDDAMKLRNISDSKQNENSTIEEAIKLINETDAKVDTTAPFSPEMKARIEDEKNVGGDNTQEMGKQNQAPEKQRKDEDDAAKQLGVVLYTFSDKVTPGLLDYSVITFYVSVVFVAGKILRGYLWGSTEKIYLSDLPYPDELLIICEGVVISRMQKDIYREEELFLVLIDLIRSPEILKIITHPNIKPKED